MIAELKICAVLNSEADIRHYISNDEMVAVDMTQPVRQGVREWDGLRYRIHPGERALEEAAQQSASGTM